MDNSEWRTVRLGERVSFVTGKLDSNAATANGKYPFFTCSRETFRTDTFSFDTECVLLAGNNAEGIFPIKYFQGKFDAYQRTYIIEPLDRKKLSTRFLFYSLRLQLEYMKRVSTGAATKFLTKTILNNLEIDIPEFETQRRIADILSAYDDLIENNTRRIRILEQMAQSIYHEWFGKVDKESLLEGWEIKNLGDVIELAYGKGLKADQRIEGDYPVYGSAGIIGYHNEYLVKSPGIIVGRKGNVGSVFWSNKDFFPIDTTYFVITGISLYYIFYNLQTQNFINNDAAVPGLNRSQAYSLPFLVPPKTTLDKFDEFIAPIFQQLEILDAKNTNLRRTRDLLLPRLVSGEIDIGKL